MFFNVPLLHFRSGKIPAWCCLTIALGVKFFLNGKVNKGRISEVLHRAGSVLVRAGPKEDARCFWSFVPIKRDKDS